MARVNVALHTDIALLMIEKLAQACRGEFFGAMTTGGIQFGFTCSKHARLFVKKLEKINVAATQL